MYLVAAAVFKVVVEVVAIAVVVSRHACLTSFAHWVRSLLFESIACGIDEVGQIVFCFLFGFFASFSLSIVWRMLLICVLLGVEVYRNFFLSEFLLLLSIPD